MEKTTAKPNAGTWDRLINVIERPPKVTFDLDKIQIVSFLEESPRESVNEEDGSAYYTFDVLHEGNTTVIQTSAWTLLTELSKFYPLKGKTLAITKKMDKGKQYFVVIQNI